MYLKGLQILIVFICLGGLTVNAQINEQVSPYVTGFTKPYVIDNNESFSFHIVTNDPDLDQVEILSAGSGLLQNGSPIDNLILFDDGNGSDEIADDNIFSTGNLTFTDSTSYVTGWFLRYKDFIFTYKDGSKTEDNIDLGFGIRRINLINIDIPTVTTIDDTMQRTTHVINLITTERTFNTRNITKKYYSKFPDDRDVIMLATTYPTPGKPAAEYRSVRITEEGTHYNSPLYDNSSTFGSNGKLMGIMYHYYTYGGTNNLVNHELLHQWAAYLNPDLKLTVDSHWGVVEVNSSGFGSGFQTSYINQVDDTQQYLACRDNTYSDHYNELELYLIGLIPLDDVDFPIRTLADFEYLGWVYEEGCNKSSYESETGILSITKSMFENSMPQRNPDYTKSQKQFKSALIVTSDRFLTAKELAYYDFQMKQNELGYEDPKIIPELGNNFQEATHGKASLKTILNLDWTYGITGFPYSESFENGLVVWINETEDDFDWVDNSGSTPTSDTGPSSAQDGSKYVYIEASSPNYPEKTSGIEAVFNFSSLSAPVLTFYYHMFGQDIGDLSMDVNDGSWHNSVWNLSGQQHYANDDPWTLATVDLYAFGGEKNLVIRFRGVTGSNEAGDIAIDNIVIFNDDFDNDGMPDSWEISRNLNPYVNDAAEDPDDDDLSNLNEYKNNTDPNDNDTDSDGMWDGWEVDYELNPLVDDADEDPDGDGYSNLKEFQRRTDPDDSLSHPSRALPWLPLLLGDD